MERYRRRKLTCVEHRERIVITGNSNQHVTTTHKIDNTVCTSSLVYIGREVKRPIDVYRPAHPVNLRRK